MAAVRSNHDQLMKEVLASTKRRFSRLSAEAVMTPSIAETPSAGKAPQSSTTTSTDRARQSSTKTVRSDDATSSKVQSRISYTKVEPQETQQTAPQPLSASKGQQRDVSCEARSPSLTAVKRSPLEVLQSQLTVTTAIAVRLGPRPYTPPNTVACEDTARTHSPGLRNRPASSTTTNKPTPKTQADDAIFTAVPVVTSPAGRLIGSDRRSVSQSKRDELDIPDWPYGVNGSPRQQECSLSSTAARGSYVPGAAGKDTRMNGDLSAAPTEAAPLHSSWHSSALQQQELTPISPRVGVMSSASPGSKQYLPRSNGGPLPVTSSKESPLSPNGVSPISPAYQEYSNRSGPANPPMTSANAITQRGHVSRGTSWPESGDVPSVKSQPAPSLSQRQQVATRSISCQTTNVEFQINDEAARQRSCPARTVSLSSRGQIQRQPYIEADFQLEPEETRVNVSALIEEFNGMSPPLDQDQEQLPLPPVAIDSPKGLAQSQADAKPNGMQKHAVADYRSPASRAAPVSGSGKELAVSAMQEDAGTYNRTTPTTSTSGGKKDSPGAFQMRGNQLKQPSPSVMAIRDGTASSSSASADAEDRSSGLRRGLSSPRLMYDIQNDAKIIGVCAVCNETIAANIGGCISMGKKYHIPCLVCCLCGQELAEQTFYTIEGNPHCRECFASTLEKCTACQEVITGKLLRAAGRPYHLSCFACAVCGGSLEGQQFMLSPNNEPHCVTDYYEIYAPRCDACNKPITPEEGEESAFQVRVFNRCFHVTCCKCEMCGKVILAQPSQDAACYPMNGRLVCKACGLSSMSARSSRLP